MSALKQEFRKKGTGKTSSGVFPRLRRYFLTGVLVTAPIGVTVFLVIVTIRFIDSWVGRILPPEYNPESYVPFSIPGIGLILVVVALTFIGWVMAGLLGRVWDRIVDVLFSRIPVVRTFFKAVKQILESILKDEKEAFKDVVLVEYPRKGLWSLGFITATTKGEIQEISDEEMVNVYIPTTPSPTAGYLLFIPRKDVKVLDMSVEQALKLIISAGMIEPESD